MKGIPTPCVKYYCQKKGIIVLDVYKKSCNNKYAKFDLTNDGNKFVCKNNKDYTMPDVSDFTRKCQYIRDGSDNSFIK